MTAKPATHPGRWAAHHARVSPGMIGDERRVRLPQAEHVMVDDRVSSILRQGGNDDCVVLEQRPYDSEALLQEALASFPAVLAGSSTVDDLSASRLLLVRREMLFQRPRELVRALGTRLRALQTKTIGEEPDDRTIARRTMAELPRQAWLGSGSTPAPEADDLVVTTVPGGCVRCIT
jgi:hypothetical protein